MTQDHIPDEVLMAYADGELTSEETEQLETRLDCDPELAARLRVFSRTGEALQALHQADAKNVLPPGLEQALRSTIGEERVEQTAPPAGNVVAFRRRAMPLWSGALAASIALGIGLGVGLMANTGIGPSETVNPVFAALDTVPSGTTATLDDGRNLRMVASFRNDQGALCREYEVSRAEGRKAVAVACHEGSGWEPQLMLALGGAEGYAPASAPELLDLYYLQSEAGTVLSPGEELDALTGLTD